MGFLCCDTQSFCLLVAKEIQPTPLERQKRLEGCLVFHFKEKDSCQRSDDVRSSHSRFLKRLTLENTETPYNCVEETERFM